MLTLIIVGVPIEANLILKTLSNPRKKQYNIIMLYMMLRRTFIFEQFKEKRHVKTKKLY